MASLFRLFYFWGVLFGQVRLYSLKLNDFISHYEALNYVPEIPKVFRRAADGRSERTHTLNFNALGRKFHFNLRPDTNTLAPDAHIIDGDGKSIEFNRDSLSVGELIGEQGSNVQGVLQEDGTFTGKIYSKDGIYFVESAKRHFNKPTGFHSVIYKEEDVKYDVKFAEPKKAPIESNYNELEENEAEETLGERYRRAAWSPDNNACRLSVEADFTFLKMAGGAILAVGEILQHVQALNIIYGRSFNTSESYAPYSIQFQVGSLQVYNEKQTPTQLKVENIDISTFLTIMSKKDYSKFCEAVYFTHRNFEGGILGLAYIGYPWGRPGGICDKRSGGNSYNTAVVTFTLYGRNSPPKVSEITFAHEVAHAFGAEHDDVDTCTPGGIGGNYIMYDKATSGDRRRNDIFSECSMVEMKANIDAKRPRIIDKKAQPQRRCLESRSRMLQRRKDFCGNGVVEGKEQCDCGHESYCKVFETTSCCDWTTCTLKSGATCSPSQGPCCGKDCNPVNNKIVCEKGNDCLKDSKCPSLSKLESSLDYSCPSQEHRDDGTACQGGALLCYKGRCSKSICTKYNLKPCECKARNEECHACCMVGNECRSAYKIKQMKRATPYNFSIGSACANNTGYCDFFQYCQRINLEGPLLHLFNLYFTTEGIKELTEKYWWAILLGTLGLIVVVVLLVVFGARYTNTDNPDGPPAKPLPKIFGRSSRSAADMTNVRELREETELREERPEGEGDETF